MGWLSSMGVARAGCTPTVTELESVRAQPCQDQQDSPERRDTCPLSCTLTSPGPRDQMCFGQFPAVTCCPFTLTSHWSCHCPWLGHGPQCRGLGQGSPAGLCSAIVTAQGVQNHCSGCAGHCHHPGFAVWLLLLHLPPQIPKNKGCFAKPHSLLPPPQDRGL